MLGQVSKSTLFQALEETAATSRVSYNTRHKLMTDDGYIKFATEQLTEGEGRLTKAQANINWKPSCISLSHD